mmetsp:Transcript_18989/g.43691  ORF Transcript_18989/g.43691 Transcript_18989/m.43691 type:complete len:242 (-) Transcript_18989:440-1165(-)
MKCDTYGSGATTVPAGKLNPSATTSVSRRKRCGRAGGKSRSVSRAYAPSSGMRRSSELSMAASGLVPSSAALCSARSSASISGWLRVCASIALSSAAVGSMAAASLRSSTSPRASEGTSSRPARDAEKTESASRSMLPSSARAPSILRRPDRSSAPPPPPPYRVEAYAAYAFSQSAGVLSFSSVGSSAAGTPSTTGTSAQKRSRRAEGVTLRTRRSMKSSNLKVPKPPVSLYSGIQRKSVS